MYVYLIRMQGTDYFKVGISINISARIETLRTGTPFVLELIESYEQERVSEVERAIHVALQQFRVQGEWFTCDLETIVAAFRAHNAMARIDDVMNSAEPTLHASSSKDTTPLLVALRRSGISRDSARALLSAYGLRFENQAWTEASNGLDGLFLQGPLEAIG